MDSAIQPPNHASTHSPCTSYTANGSTCSIRWASLAASTTRAHPSRYTLERMFCAIASAALVTLRVSSGLTRSVSRATSARVFTDLFGKSPSLTMNLSANRHRDRTFCFCHNAPSFGYVSPYSSHRCLSSLYLFSQYNLACTPINLPEGSLYAGQSAHSQHGHHSVHGAQSWVHGCARRRFGAEKR